ncbi:uncharacterized protein LOC111073646 isoform X4 [Drosophila obscura]|uniref:uncharacterized protein LOC111073646 isoform X4 n=1 Tax=Drosophila obscura TaxID=7282 RepID=UPI000B9FA8B2|nr:uncharacterized protein LOC111073646 isoform X4 [Drosophila obscura]
MFFQLYRTMEIYENLPSHLQNIPKIYRGIPVQSNKRKNFKQKCITKESFVEKLKNLVLSLEKGILKEQENVRQLKLVTGAMELDLEVPTLHCRDHIWSNRCSNTTKTDNRPITLRMMIMDLQEGGARD